MKQQEMIEKIDQLQTKVNHMTEQYWSQFSHLGTWQFWYHIALLAVPLLILYYSLNRQRIFEILFFGYTNHVIFSYIDSFMVRYGYWDHPYMILPQYPFVLSINASLLPVPYMLVYQYCTEHKKNFYLWALITAFSIGIVFVEIHKHMNIFQLHKVNNFHVFMINFTVAVISYWATHLFLYIQKKTKRKLFK